MDPIVIQKFQKFKLREAEESGFKLDSKDVQSSKDECIKSLIGKIFGDKVVNFTGLKTYK